MVLRQWLEDWRSCWILLKTQQGRFLDLQAPKTSNSLFSRFTDTKPNNTKSSNPPHNMTTHFLANLLSCSNVSNITLCQDNAAGISRISMPEAERGSDRVRRIRDRSPHRPRRAQLRAQPRDLPQILPDALTTTEYKHCRWSSCPPRATNNQAKLPKRSSPAA